MNARETGKAAADRADRRREPYRPRPRYDQYAPLKVSLTITYNENKQSELKDKSPPIRSKGLTDTNKYCEYHSSLGHSTEECVNLKDNVERLVREGRQHQYIQGPAVAAPPAQPRVSPQGKHTGDEHPRETMKEGVVRPNLLEHRDQRTARITVRQKTVRETTTGEGMMNARGTTAIRGTEDTKPGWGP